MSALPSSLNYGAPEEPPHEPPRRRAAWKRVLGWTGVVVLILIAVVVLAIFVLLYTGPGKRQVLRIAEQKASAALRSPVQAQSFAFHLSGTNPAVDLYNAVVQGSMPPPNPPLLTLQHLRLGLHVVSLAQRKWYLNQVTMDHPVAHILADRNGADNLPKTSGQSSSKTNIFDVGVRHVRLNQGEIIYNNRKSVLSADLRNVNFQAAFNTADRSYSGNLAYTDGIIRFDKYNPLPHDLNASFTVSPTQFTLQRAVLASGRSQFVLAATLTDYSHPHVQATYDAVLDTRQLATVLKNSSLPAGTLHLTGSMRYVSKPSRPLLDTAVLRGNLSSPALLVRSPSFSGDIRELRANYVLQNGKLHVMDLRGQVLGGEVTGMAAVDLAGATRSQLQLNLRGASLAALQSAAQTSATQNVGLSGTANLNVNAHWGKNLNSLIANLTGNVQGNVTPPATTAPVPLTGNIQARYDAASKQLTLGPSYVRTPQMTLNLAGGLGKGRVMTVRLRSTDLSQLAALAPSPAVHDLGLAGAASFDGTVRQSAAGISLSGQLTGSNVRVRGSQWRSVRANINAGPSRLSVENALLQSPTGGQVMANINAGLRNWSLAKTSPFQLTLKVANLRTTELEGIAGRKLPLRGIVSANVALRGSQETPVGQGTVSLKQANIANQPVQLMNLNFQANGATVDGKLLVDLPAGTAQAAFSVNPRQEQYNAQLRAVGIQLGQLEALKARGMAVSGMLNLTAHGSGTFSNPAGQLSLEIPKLQAAGQTISGVSLQGNLANHVANVSLDSQVVNTFVRARGTVNLTGNYDTTATLDTQAIPLQPLIAIYAPAQAANITGQTEIHGTLRGPLKNMQQVDAHFVMPTLTINYKNAVQIGAANPIRLDYAKGVLALQRITIRGTETELQIQGTVPMYGTAPSSIMAVGTVNLALVQAVNPNVTSSGQIRFDINSYGKTTNPNVEGRIQIINANFASGTAPLGMQDGNGVLTLRPDRLEITQFRAMVGGGPLTLHGALVYRPTMSFDIAARGRGIRMLYPAGVRETFHTDLTLTGSPESALLRGDVRLQDLTFTPDFDLMTFMSQFGGTAVTPPTRGFAQNLKLDVALASATGINAVSRELSLQGTANLQVQGTAAQPVALGRINISGGDLIFMSNRYELQTSTIDLMNPVQTQAVVNVLATTTIQQYNIQLHFVGPVDRMRTMYTSDPSLPPSDIINLLAFGKTTEAAAANPTPGTLGAESTIASQVSSQVTSRVEKIAGISQLSIDPVLGTYAGQNPGARITVQQRVTGNLFVTFATDATSTQRQVIQGQYRFSPRISISVTRDQNGGFGFDTRIHKTW